jgi:hypothetical protein
MKKYFSILFAVLAALTIFTSTVFAASGNKSVTLVSVSYQKGGIVLLFDTAGLTKGDLKDTSFFAKSNNHKMFCNFVDDTTKVRCTVSKGLAGGGEFYATLAGFGFWGVLPEPKSFGPVCTDGEIVWYTINVYESGELVDSGELPAWLWSELVAEGIIDEAAEFGITFEITGTLCAPDFDFGPVE